MPKTYEEIYIDKIRRGIKLIIAKKTTPKDAKLGAIFTKLKPLNEGMYHELMNDYRAATQGLPDEAKK